MNWIKSTDRLPEDLPEYAGRKRVKCLVAYQTQCGWQWKAICRYKEHGEWRWGEHLNPDYWCIPENPYQPLSDQAEETGMIRRGMTLKELYFSEEVGADAVIIAKDKAGEVVLAGTWGRISKRYDDSVVENYQLTNYDLTAGKYNAVEVWLA